jgi:hypothetical protein
VFEVRVVLEEEVNLLLELRDWGRKPPRKDMSGSELEDKVSGCYGSSTGRTVVGHRRSELDDLWLRRGLSLGRLFVILVSYQAEMVEIGLDLGRRQFLVVMAGLGRVTASTRQVEAVRHGRNCQEQAGWLLVRFRLVSASRLHERKIAATRPRAGGRVGPLEAGRWYKG